ncbi:group 1 glycosyl transferase [Vibrio cholerae]|nr:putative acetyltransferase [Vibrio cholerae]GHY28920.1 group 1 glycosyl transferase [Vibrio cholerae]
MLDRIFYVLSKVIKKIYLPSVIHSKIHSSSKIEGGSSVVSTVMGKHSFCGYACDIYFADIGNFTSIASGVIIGGARHPMEWVGMSPVFYKGRDSIKKKFTEYKLPLVPKVVIGSDVWIGRNAIILSGVKIGHGAVIGAGSVVTKDVAPFSVVAGNPASIKKFRFNTAIIEDLLETEWWNLDESRLNEVVQFIREPEVFITKIKEIRRL